MVVWGKIEVEEGEEERDVREELDMVVDVVVLGAEVGVKGMEEREGVVKGKVEVRLGEVGEGMVEGEEVNKEARK